MSIPAYAGLGPFQIPIDIEQTMRGIGRVFSGSKILRTCGGFGGDNAFEDGARIGGGAVELYTLNHIRPWAAEHAQRLDPTLAKMPQGYQERAAACLSAVLGIEGSQPVQELIVWLDPDRSGPQYWAILAANERGIAVHDLASDSVGRTWADWVAQHTTKYSSVRSEYSGVAPA